MGSEIAAYVAGMGLPCYLLDMVPEELTDEETAKGLTLDDPAVRNRLANLGVQNALMADPPAFFDVDDAALIRVGNLEDNMDWLGGADWIVEAVTENLDLKKRLLKNVEKFRSEGSIVSSTTSVVSIREMGKGLSKEMRQHFLGAHFLNPVRYVRLLELVPGPNTEAEVLDFLMRFCEKVLGKGVVVAKDKPYFIANRLGTFGIMAAIKATKKMGHRIEEVDRILGCATGRGATGVFARADDIGVDVLMNVAQKLHKSLPDDPDRDVFRPPPLLKKMVAKNMLGDTTGRGFYRRAEVGGARRSLALDLDKMDYREREEVEIDSLSEAENIDDPGERVKALVYAEDRGGKSGWRAMCDVLVYAVERVPEIADDIVGVDNAVRWGLDWEIGPFEAWDAIGVAESVSRMEQEGRKIPENVRRVLEEGKGSFYVVDKRVRKYFDFTTGKYKPVEPNSNVTVLKGRKAVKANRAAALVDIGDGVACLKFRAEGGAIDAAVVQMVFESIEEVNRNFVGLVIGNTGSDFSVGADLRALLAQIKEKNWDGVEKMCRRFQEACTLLRHSDAPVVAAPFGFAAGSGAEIAMGADRICAHVELRIGLADVGFGLMPGGGGTKELLLRCTENAPPGPDVDLLPYVKRAFEPIATGKVSTSAKEARKIGFLRPTDRIIPNRDHLINDAKRAVLAMVEEGYVRPQRRGSIRIVGERGYAALKADLLEMRWGHRIGDHDVVVADKLAYVLCGGKLPGRVPVDEQYLLDLEREAFVSLCGCEKTQERMERMLNSDGSPRGRAFVFGGARVAG
jgi:3-hydroxyacyl-CoA dehydrogenase